MSEFAPIPAGDARPAASRADGGPAPQPTPGGTPRATVPTTAGTDRVRVEWSITDVDPLMILPVAGHAFAIPVPADWPSDSSSLSTLMLLEDGRPLPWPHCQPADIARTGRGRYGHWTDELRFSSTDNSDPRTNARRYAVARGDAFLFKHAPRPPSRELGRAWVLDGLPDEWRPAGEGRSWVQLLEDGRTLGPGASSRDAIRAEGSGRFGHWGRQLWFSTSDDSDPLTNGRTYTVVWSPPDDE